MKITLEIPETVFKSISRSFPDKGDKDEVVRSIAKIATLEWAEWMNASFRPNSLSDLTLKRVDSIFSDNGLYKGRMISRNILFNQFNIPYGQASYIERVYSEKNQPSYILETVDNLVEKLEGQYSEWSKSDQKKSDQSFTIEVNSLGHRILQSLMQEIKESGKSIAPKLTMPSVRGYFIYTFVAVETNLIIDKLKTFKTLIQNGNK